MTNYELTHPHDLLVREFLCAPDLMADFLQRHAKHPIINVINMSSLRNESPVNVDSELVERVGDLVFLADFVMSEIDSDDLALFFEHQSTQDRMMPFRSLEQITLFYRKRLDLKQETNSKGLVQKKKKRSGKRIFPYPIVVILYHGVRPWASFAQMADLIKNTMGCESNILNFTFILVDISTYQPNDFLGGHPANQALLLSLQAASTGELMEQFEHIVQVLVKAKDDPRIYGWLKSIIRYVMSLCRPPRAEEIIFNAYRTLLNEEEAKKMATSYNEELLLQGEKRGKIQGEAIGEATSVILILRTRFNKVPNEIMRRVRSYNDVVALKSLVVLATSCQSLEEFQNELK